MIKSHLILATIIFFLGITTSCNKEDLFTQPTIKVTSISLLELPTTTTSLEIEVELTNNDTREANISDAEYTVTIEGYNAETEKAEINQKITTSAPLTLTLPLKLITKDAIQILKKLDAGQDIQYSVTGTFHVNDPILKYFDLPINVQGTTAMDIGFDDFFKQPEVTIQNLDYEVEPGLSNYTFNFDVNCTVQNMDPNSAEIDDVEYTVFIEGAKSQTHNYSDTYNTNIQISGNETITLQLPVTLSLSLAEGISFISKLADGNADYEIEGTFHTTKINNEINQFYLPLYETGSVPISEVIK